jgi:hypothetical protein
MQLALLPPSIAALCALEPFLRGGGKPCFLKQFSIVWLSLPQKVQIRVEDLKLKGPLDLSALSNALDSSAG